MKGRVESGILLTPRILSKQYIVLTWIREVGSERLREGMQQSVDLRGEKELSLMPNKMGGEKNNGGRQRQEVVPSSAKETRLWNLPPALRPPPPPHSLWENMCCDISDKTFIYSPTQARIHTSYNTFKNARACASAGSSVRGCRVCAYVFAFHTLRCKKVNKFFIVETNTTTHMATY